ncbi:hypothetical protein MtrunA17_Chr7g0241661 [Medicago truncatula]|uniref:ELM2 domain-containing protein n=1 Tax=Medicago truncatula TaxID=3880 RepID=A0A072U1T4_MEDTR|nr:uncharacterized protein LOC25498720 isoform X2 [Medicago truncatula]KEH23133.1 hypothetical protein MTR_7g066880 [Medicago truncatula]RHN46386.1 hypothetical protein MtrunA17_Chr7g0241661 [Medicago truncatula]
MIWLKDKTFKPCEEKSSHHIFQNQKHKDQVVLTSSSKDPPKRKFNQYINDGNCATSFELIGKEKYSGENAKDQRKNSSHSLSCYALPDGTQEYVSPSINDNAKFCGISTQDYSHLSDFDDSIKGSSYLVNQESFNIHARDLMVSNRYLYGIETSIEEKSKEEDMEVINSLKNFLPSRGNHLPRPVIPIGPRFQAEVRKWGGIANIKQYNSDDSLKWLGTQIWPMPNACKTNAKGIGDDMLNSCMCDNPELVNCVKKRIGEAIECLKSEIDTGYSSRKFDDIEEYALKSWTVEEQKKFESLKKLNLLSSYTKFSKLIMEYFPSQSMTSMMNYYYNVYIPRCMSIETRSILGAVDRESKLN